MELLVPYESLLPIALAKNTFWWSIHVIFHPGLVPPSKALFEDDGVPLFLDKSLDAFSTEPVREAFVVSSAQLNKNAVNITW